MIDIKVDKKGIQISIFGSTVDIATEFGVAIFAVQQQMRERDEKCAEEFLQLVRGFLNGYDFKKEVDENISNANKNLEEMKEKLAKEGIGSKEDLDKILECLFQENDKNKDDEKSATTRSKITKVLFDEDTDK